MKTIIRKLIIIIELSLSILMYGCAGYWWPVHRDMYEILDSYKIHTVAVMPIRNSHLDSNETKEVNLYFFTGITKSIKKYILINPQECLEKLNRDSLTEKYYLLFEDIHTPENTLGKLIKDAGKSIGCDAIIQGEISDFTNNTYVDQNKIITSCGVSYRLYSTKDGNHLWGNYVESYINSDIKSGPAPLINVVKAGINNLFLFTHN
jgi:hypothetical protein